MKMLLMKAGNDSGGMAIAVLVLLSVLAAISMALVSRGQAEIELIENVRLLDIAESSARGAVYIALEHLKSNPSIVSGTTEVVIKHPEEGFAMLFRDAGPPAGYVNEIVATGRYGRAAYSLEVLVETDPYPRRILSQTRTDRHILFDGPEPD